MENVRINFELTAPENILQSKINTIILELCNVIQLRKDENTLKDIINYNIEILVDDINSLKIYDYDKRF